MIHFIRCMRYNLLDSVAEEQDFTVLRTVDPYFKATSFASNSASVVAAKMENLHKVCSRLN